jgi:hypothetical protein
VRRGELDVRQQGETAVTASGFVTFSKYYYGGWLGHKKNKKCEVHFGLETSVKRKRWRKRHRLETDTEINQK